MHRYFLNARRIFKDIAKEVRQFKPGAEVAPGIVSIPAYGHTPGHTAFAIHSGNQSMLVMSDAVRNPYLFARHPDWQPIFDMDGAAGGESAPRHARPRRRRPHAGRGLSFPLPGLRPHRQDRRPATNSRRSMWAPLVGRAQNVAPARTMKVRPASG